MPPFPELSPLAGHARLPRVPRLCPVLLTPRPALVQAAPGLLLGLPSLLSILASFHSSKVIFVEYRWASVPLLLGAVLGPPHWHQGALQARAVLSPGASPPSTPGTYCPMRSLPWDVSLSRDCFVSRRWGWSWPSDSSRWGARGPVQPRKGRGAAAQAFPPGGPLSPGEPLLPIPFPESPPGPSRPAFGCICSSLRTLLLGTVAHCHGDFQLCHLSTAVGPGG